MSTIDAVLSMAAAGLFLFTGSAKVSGNPRSIADAERFGLPQRVYRLIGGCELAGAAGVLLGWLIWSTIGVLAATGLVLLMLGALAFHLRAKDELPALAPAAGSGVLALACLISQLVT